ncbi:MAG: leucine-rich repeat domain-containing protein [Oscillospiraceae bacterium]|nr:leucine-rich repeat domain-containing protein [Oscillospiraceae bacterium]
MAGCADRSADGSLQHTDDTAVNTVSEAAVTEETEKVSREDIVESGMLGDDVFYTLTNDGTLDIHGSGDMYDYKSEENKFYEDGRVKRVIIEDGITGIGEYAFFCCHGIESVSILGSVTMIGEEAFYSCDGLTEIVIPEGVTDI